MSVSRSEIWRVATLNIWNRSGPWARRLPLIRDQLLALDVDAIGLQEVLGLAGHPSQADELVEGTPWHVFHAPAWDLGGEMTLGNAILSRHPLRDTAVLPLPPAPGRDQRSVCFARVELPHGPMPLFVTHLTYQMHLGSVRCAQVRALVEHVDRLAPIEDTPPAVVMGDFNAEPDADEIRYMRGLATLEGRSVYFTDCWVTGDGPGHTYDRRNLYANRSREPSRRIDYIFVRGPDRRLRGEPRSARVALDQPTDGVWPSDHFAVVADIIAAPQAYDPY